MHKQNSEGYNVLTFADVYRVRREVTSIANKTKEQANLNIRELDIEVFSKGLEYYCMYIKEVVRLEKEKGVKVYRPLSKAGWMDAIMTDVIFAENKLFYKDPIRLANNCVKYCNSISPLLLNICGSNEAYTISSVLQANRIMRGLIV